MLNDLDIFWGRGENYGSQSDLEKQIKTDVETVAKEAGQNSIDARIQSGTLEIEINLLKVNKETKEHFMQLIGLNKKNINSLDEKISLMNDLNQNNKNKYIKLQELLKSKRDFYTLLISDYNAQGLKGRDCGKMEVGQNFIGFNKVSGISNKENSLGSRGTGRKAILGMSELQYCYQISNPIDHEENKGDLRMFGRGELDLFVDKNLYFHGNFSLGLISKECSSYENPIDCDHSYWMDKDLIKNHYKFIHDDRFIKNGTTLIYPFINFHKFNNCELDYDEGLENCDCDIQNIIERLRQGYIDSFFPLIGETDPGRSINIGIYESVLSGNKADNYVIKNEGDLKVDHYSLDMIQNMLVGNFNEDKTFFDGEDDILIEGVELYLNGNSSVDLKIPNKTPRQPQIQFSVPIKLLSINWDMIYNKEIIEKWRTFNRKIIYARDGMVIGYEECKFPSEQDFIGFINIDKRDPKLALLSEFVRLMENEKHDKWRPTNNYMKNSDYGVRGVKAGRQISKDLVEFVKKIYEMNYTQNNTFTLFEDFFGSENEGPIEDEISYKVSWEELSFFPGGLNQIGFPEGSGEIKTEGGISRKPKPVKIITPGGGRGSGASSGGKLNIRNNRYKNLEKINFKSVKKVDKNVYIVSIENPNLGKLKYQYAAMWAAPTYGAFEAIRSKYNSEKLSFDCELLNKNGEIINYGKYVEENEYPLILRMKGKSVSKLIDKIEPIQVEIYGEK